MPSRPLSDLEEALSDEVQQIQLFTINRIEFHRFFPSLIILDLFVGDHDPAVALVESVEVICFQQVVGEQLLAVAVLGFEHLKGFVESIRLYPDELAFGKNKVAALSASATWVDNQFMM